MNVHRPIARALIATCMLALLGGCGGKATPPSPLTIASDSAYVPTTAIDPASGTRYFAWIARDDGQANAYLARMEPGRDAPGAPVRVNHIDGDAHVHAQAPAQVAIGPDGAVYVAWVNSRAVDGRRFPASDLRFARSTDGGRTFEPALTVNDDAGALPSSHSFHDLAVGPDGAVYVSWLDTRERDRVRRTAARSEKADPPSDLPGTEIRVARSTDDGRSFGRSIVVARGTCECCRTAIDVGPDGAVYVAWRHLFGDNVRDIAMARSSDGGRSFTAPARVHEDRWHLEGCPHSGPSLEVDAQGRIHVAWYTGAPGRAGLYYAVSTDGGAGFAAPQTLITDVPVSQVKVAVDAENRVGLLWEDRKRGGLTLARPEESPRADWTTEAIPSGREPALAAGRDTLVATWASGRSVQARIAPASGGS